MKKSIVPALLLCSLFALGQSRLYLDTAALTKTYHGGIVNKMDSSGFGKPGKTDTTFINSVPYVNLTGKEAYAIKYDTVPCIIWMSDTSAGHITGLVYQVRGFKIHYLETRTVPLYGNDITIKYLYHKKRPFPSRYMIPFSFLIN